MEKQKASELPIGGIIDKGGTAKKFQTGDWRSFKPVLNPQKCIHCLFCWVYCPDSSIVIKDGKMAGFLYEYCKGCGICADECPPKAIEMVREV